MTTKYGKQFYCIFSVCGNLFLTGLALGWASPALPKLLDPQQTPFDHVLSQAETAIMTSLTMCCVLILPLADPISRRFGRKRLIVGIVATRAFNWLATSQSSSVHLLYLIKFLEGHTIGLTYSISVVYISEIVSVPIRGLALTCIGIFINLGILAVYAIGPFVSYSALGLIAAGCSLTVLVFVLFIPESPTYLITKGRNEEAKCLVRSLKLFLDTEKQSEEFQAMIRSSTCEKREESYWYELRQLLGVRKNLKAFGLVSAAVVAPSLTGILPILMHMTTIFEKSGTTMAPHIATIIVAAVQVLPSMASGLLVDRVGRKVLLLTSCGVVCLCNLMLGVVFYLEHVQSSATQYLSWVPLVCLITFVVFYAIGLGIIPGTLIGELLDVKVKSIGSSLCVVQSTSVAMVAIYTFGYLNDALGAHCTFWLYSLFSAATFLFIHITLPETKGKTFAEIQEMLN